MVDTDDTRRTTYDGRRTTPRVWHKLPTGELITHSESDGQLDLKKTRIQQDYPAINKTVK